MTIAFLLISERFGFGCLDDATVAAVREALNSEVLPRHLGFFEKLLEQSSSGWIAGTPGPSIADFQIVPRLQWLASGANDGISTDILKPFPRVLALIDKLMTLPAIVEYYKNKN